MFFIEFPDNFHNVFSNIITFAKNIVNRIVKRFYMVAMRILVYKSKLNIELKKDQI